MKFQLVLQFSSFSLASFDEIVELEDLLMAKLGSQNDVDGHDIGVGEINIFVFTEEPNATFDEIRSILSSHRMWPEIRAAYRPANGGEYIVLWPQGIANFTVR